MYMYDGSCIYQTHYYLKMKNYNTKFTTNLTQKSYVSADGMRADATGIPPATRGSPSGLWFALVERRLEVQAWR